MDMAALVVLATDAASSADADLWADAASRVDAVLPADAASRPVMAVDTAKFRILFSIRPSRKNYWTALSL
jgi:hypothetical protein